MTRFPIRKALALLLLWLSFNRGLAAQTTLSQLECDRAAGVVSRGRVSANEMWALLNISACGTVGANAIATGIGKLTNHTDTAQFEVFMGAADNWRDASIFNAAMQLANNASATPEARVYAIRHLLTLLQPYHRWTYAGLAESPDSTATQGGGGCYGYMGSEPRGSIAGSPLPSTYESQIREALSTLANDLAAPQAVRAAARCLIV